MFLWRNITITFYSKSREWRAERGERRGESGERRAVSGERRAEKGERRAVSGERWAESGERRAVSREWRAESGEHYLFAIINTTLKMQMIHRKQTHSHWNCMYLHHCHLHNLLLHYTNSHYAGRKKVCYQHLLVRYHCWKDKTAVDICEISKPFFIHLAPN